MWRGTPGLVKLGEVQDARTPSVSISTRAPICLLARSDAPDLPIQRWGMYGVANHASTVGRDCSSRNQIIVENRNSVMKIALRLFCIDEYSTRPCTTA